MQITIIGAGNMARDIPTRALPGGHTVRIIDRGPGQGRPARRLPAGNAAAATSRRPPWRPGIGRGWIVPLPMRASPALCFPCYEGCPGNSRPARGIPGRCRQDLEGAALAELSIPCWQPLVPTGNAQDIQNFFRIMPSSWRIPLRNRTVDLLLTMPDGFV